MTTEHRAQLTPPSLASQWVDRLHGPATAWVILSISIIITIIAWKISTDYAESRARERFYFQIDEAQSAIAKRFSNYEQMLRGGLGLFKSSRDVTRSEWREYIETLEIETFFPGTLGVGYSVWLSPAELPRHIKQVRAEGFPAFTVNPAGKRAHYSSIIYLEPFHQRNQRAFGYDMYSNPVRREAMDRARDTGMAAISGRVTLVQEVTTDVQYGFLIYLPHYRREVHTLQERRDNLAGFVYSPLRMGDLMHGILGVGLPELDFAIYDGSEMIPDNMLYHSAHTSDQDKLDGANWFHATKTLRLGGRTWSIAYNSNRAFEKAMNTSQPLFVAIGGIVIDLLLFYVILSLGRLRKQALSLADARMQTLQNKELQFKNITDNASDGIITLDRDGLIIYLNKAAQEIFGLKIDTVLAKPLLTLIPISHHHKVKATLQQLAQDSGTTTHAGAMEIEGIAETRPVFPLEISISHVYSPENTGYTVIARDISERKRMEQMKSEFISTVSHELRTPLAAISGSLSLVENAVVGPVSDKVMELVRTAMRNCKRLNTLVDDILDSEKLASGKMRFEIKSCNILPLVTHAIEINQPYALRANVSIKLTDSSDVILQLDPDRFVQAFTNLLANAIKFSPAGDTVEVGVSVAGDSVRIHVTDHGAGIPESFRGKIFEKFAQVDSTDARKYGGTGLGLSIVKFIIEQFKGRVDFTSVPDQATTFYLELPLRADAESLAS